MKTIIVLLFLLNVIVNNYSFANETALKGVLQANTLFTSAVYKELSKTRPKENFLFSPISAETIIALSQFGATSETAQELRTALHLPNDQESIRAGFKSLLTKLLKNGQQNSVRAANKLYIKEKITFKPQFKKVASEDFRGEIENINFQSAQAADVMNQWVEQKTEQKIKNLISPGDLDSTTRLILINALYFKGNWTNQFDTEWTRKMKFYKSASELFDVDMMVAGAHFNMQENLQLDAKILEMPFVEDEAALIIILPNKRDGLETIERNENLLKLVFQKPHLKDVNVDLVLPKFRIETKTDLKEILKNLGVQKAFTSGNPFSDISPDTEDLYISKILQKSYIDVNESGVEAAAATFSESVDYILHESTKVIVDHPFIFYVKVGDVIVFAGRVTDPRNRQSVLQDAPLILTRL